MTRDIEHQIRNLPPGAEIPPARAYAHRGNCSGETARRALAALAEQGWLISDGTKRGYKRSDKMPIPTLGHLAVHLTHITGRTVSEEDALQALTKIKEKRGSVTPDLDALLPNETSI